MHSQPLKKPILMPSDPSHYNPQKAVAILAAFTTKHQGGTSSQQEQASKIATRYLTQGMSAISAIQWAVSQVMQASKNVSDQPIR